jgi:uncharacterized membrane protein YdjX (TVP38/TMEM64 family)
MKISSLTAKKILLLAVFIALAGLYFALDLGQYLTLENLKESRQAILGWYDKSPILVIAAYMLVYIAVTSLSLPGAAVMSLAGGAIFGLWVGIVVVSFASAIGATSACAVSRFVLGNWVAKKLGPRMDTFNKGVERDGAFYLFTLRVLPAFPFWLINLGMGLTRMPLKTFYWVSQLGMLTGTFIFVNAGVQLARVEKVGDIFSLGLIASLAILAVFPLVAKKAINFYLRKKGRTIPQNPAVD